MKIGFTLIEISIALVIIGLLAGGVLVGQDLVEVAKNRSQISQLSEYKVAIQTFRLKYNALPGDIQNPSQFGLSTCTYSCQHTHNGNGLINDNDNATPYPLKPSGDITAVFTHLSEAKLIKEAFSLNSGLTINRCSGSAAQFPTLKVGRGGVVVVSLLGEPYFLLTMNACTAPVLSVNSWLTNQVITPRSAFYIDSKLDNGIPNTGSVIAVRGATGAVDTFDGECVKNSGNDYNLDYTDIACKLYIRAQ